MSLRNKKSTSDDRYIRTTMIGAISAIECVLGKLWGIDKPPDKRTDFEDDVFGLFLEVREKILDLGNSQIEKFNNRSLNRKRNFNDN
jgi:hypothetical protein